MPEHQDQEVTIKTKINLYRQSNLSFLFLFLYDLIIKEEESCAARAPDAGQCTFHIHRLHVYVVANDL